MRKLLLTATILTVLAAPAFAKPYLDIREIHTKGGLTAWMVNDKTIPIFALKFSVKGGAQNDPQGKEGLTELLSSTLDEGAGARDSETVQNALDANGIRMGFNATRDRFVGSLKTTTAHQDLAVALFDDALNRPHFARDAVERMKQAILSNQRFEKADPNWLAGKALFETLFPGQPYGRTVDGSEESIKSLTTDDLKTYRPQTFCKDDLKIAVVGDIAPDKAEAMIDKVFGAWPTCGDVNSAPEVDPVNLGKRVDVPWQGAQSVVLMAQPGLARQDKDWWAARILDFGLGGGEFSSRLMDEVRVKRGLTYGVGTALVPYDLSPLWIVQSGIDAPKTDEALSVIRQIWGDVAKDGLKDDEIKEAKSYLIGSLPLALTSTDNIAAIVLQLQEDGLPMDTLDRRADEINAVTVKDVKRVANERLHADQLTTIVVGPQKAAATTDKKKK